jgi:hypothetical protein
MSDRSTMMNVNSSPWYREPMVWLVFAIPLLTIPAGLATWVIAAQQRTDAVPTPVKRLGQVQTEDLGADYTAARLGLFARLTLDRAQGIVRVAFEGATPESTPRLTLAHPVNATRDRLIALRPGGRGSYHGAIGTLDANAWTATLEANDGHWRLAGRIAAGADAARLTPALPAN